MKNKISLFYFGLFFLQLINNSNYQLFSQDLFELNTKKEIIISGISAISIYTAYTLDKVSKIQTINEIKSLNKNSIPKFDQCATQYYSESLSTISDLFLITSLITPLSLFLINDSKKDISDISVLYLETILLNYGINSFTKSLTKRFRPYVYNEDVKLEKKLTLDARKSFFSGHSSTAFASAVFFSRVVSELNINPSTKSLVWVSSLSIATTIAILRVISGYHYPSDVIIGALVGSGIGFLITELHKKNKSNLLFTNSSNFSINFSLSLNKR